MELIWVALGCGAVFAVDYLTTRAAARNGSGSDVRHAPLPGSAQDFASLVANANALGQLFDEKFAPEVSAQLGGKELVAGLKGWSGESIRVDDAGRQYIQCGETQVETAHLNAIAIDLGAKADQLAADLARLKAVEKTWCEQSFSERIGQLSDNAQVMLLSAMKLGFLLDIDNPSITRKQLDELCQAT